MSVEVCTPLAPPPTISEVTTSPKVNDDQENMAQTIVEHFSGSYKLPGEEKGELMDEEKLWLSYECVLRYLRATSWKVAEAITRLESTLKWRREFGLYTTLTPDYIEDEARTGGGYILGFDTKGRPAYHIIPSLQNPKEATRQAQFIMFMLERALELLEPGVETLDVLVNYRHNSKNLSVSAALTFISVFQAHYPERLGGALISHVPWYLSAFFKLIQPFIEPVTRSKMHFDAKLVKDGFFKPDQITKEWYGGNLEFTYDHDKYWPALLELCEKRREAWKSKWKALGGVVGLKEWDFKSGHTFPTASEVLLEKTAST